MRLLPSSLAGRLLLGSALFTSITVGSTLILMQQVLSRFVTGQIDQRLDNKIVALASQLRVGGGGRIAIEGDADGPPFSDRRHDAFWWVAGPANAVHSRWLAPGYAPGAATLKAAETSEPEPPPPPDLDGAQELPHPRTVTASGPDGERMHMRVARRSIDGVAVTILVAAPPAAFAGPMREAMTTVGLAMAGLAAALVLAAFAQVRVGLRPLARLRVDVAAVREGRRQELPLAQPREVVPLVVELNDLLAQNASNLERARRHVANLAHGLKTPLATMALTLDRLPRGEREDLRHLVDLVERRVRHHLGRARAAALSGQTRSRTPLAERLRDIGDALTRIYEEDGASLDLEMPDGAAVACEPQDVDEIFGNLLDNAFKYAGGRVSCVGRFDGPRMVVEILDDGPGLTETEIGRMLRPGQRLDEDVPGFGFGLSIAREMVELYAGDLRLESREKGLKVTIILPRAT